MKKIAIWVPKIEYVSGWTDSNILAEMAFKFSIFIFFPSDEVEKLLRSKLDKETLNKIELRLIHLPRINRISEGLRIVQSLRLRNSTKSFRYNFKRSFVGEVKLIPYPITLKSIIYSFYSNIRNIYKFFVNYPLSFFLFIPIISLIIEKIYRFMYDRLITPLPVFFPLDLDLFIIISGAREIRTSELIKALKIKGITTFLSIQNWDNLTSKNYLLDQPDYIGVMGNNCVKTVSSTQNIDSKHIIACGLPRFNPYRLKNYTVNKSQGKVYTVLYLGTSLPHNENNLLNSISNYLENVRINNKKCRLIYKPHPNRRPRYLEEVLSSNVEVVSVRTQNYPEISSEHI